MTHRCMLHMSKPWFRLLERLYPHHFRDEMGNAVVEAYRDRAHHSLQNGGKIHLVALWFRALIGSLRNGPAERARPAASCRRAGNWGLVPCHYQRQDQALYRGFARGLSHTIEVDSGRMIPRVEKVSAVTFQVTNMQVTVQFYRDVLGMELLYGGEDSHFSSLRAREKSLQSSICKRAIPQSVGVD